MMYFTRPAPNSIAASFERSAGLCMLSVRPCGARLTVSVTASSDCGRPVRVLCNVRRRVLMAQCKRERLFAVGRALRVFAVCSFNPCVAIRALPGVVDCRLAPTLSLSLVLSHPVKELSLKSPLAAYRRQNDACASELHLVGRSESNRRPLQPTFNPLPVFPSRHPRASYLSERSILFIQFVKDSLFVPAILMCGNPFL